MSHPNHLAIIMDGNGRWAKGRFLPRIEGHRRGVETVRTVVKAARSRGIEHLSVFAFSSENWNRPREEVNALLNFFVAGLKQEAEPLLKADVRLHVVGDRSVFSDELVRAIEQAEDITRNATGMHFNVCINYGGRDEIKNAVRAIAQQVKNGEIQPEDITEEAARRAAAAGFDLTVENIDRYLGMPWSGPVDLMIRTGGEQRISNFILWQAAYAELWFTEKLWPEFSEADLDEALKWFAGRERRFGKTSEQIRNGA